MTARRTALRFLRLMAATALLSSIACSSDDGPASGGFDSPRAVVDAHIDASRAYDIEADCNLLTPERRRELAGLDGLEVDGYCATVTAPIVAAADAETKARTRALYTEPRVAELDRASGTWFSMVATDGSYVEQIETVEVDGRWWIATIESDIQDEDNDHLDDVLPDDPPEFDVPGPTAAG